MGQHSIWVKPAAISLVLISTNGKLSNQMQRLAELLNYQFRLLQDPIDDMDAVNNANLIIVDIVNESKDVMRLRTNMVSRSIPMLWIVPDNLQTHIGKRVLVNPFTVEQAVSAIQSILFEPISNSDHSLSQTFLTALLMVSSPKTILKIMSQYLLDIVNCERVGVLTFDDQSHGHWAYWRNAPSEAVQNSLLEKLIVEQPLTAGWCKTPFVSGDVLGVVLVEVEDKLEDRQRNILKEVASLTAKVWVRELALSHASHRIAEMQAFDNVSQAIVTELDINEVLEDIANSARWLVNAQTAMIWLKREQQFVMVAQSGIPISIQSDIAVDRDPFDTLGQTHQVLHLDGYDLPEDVFPTDLLLQTLCMPLSSAGDILGFILVANPIDGVFLLEDEWRMRSLASWSTIALTNASLHAKTQSALKRERAYRARVIQTEKLTALGQLVASVAHEINNPLQAAQSGLDLILDTGEFSDGVKKDLEIIQQTIDQIGDVIKRIRQIYRMPDQNPIGTQLNDLIKDVTEMVSHHVYQRQVKLVLDLDPNLPILVCIPHEIRQVFMNLILNAVDAVDKGGRIRIQSQYIVNQQKRLIVVEDDGQGIPHDKLSTIFQPFFTTKSDGSGLGLAISQDIINQYGGQITAISQAGNGSTFMIWLPLNTKLLNSDNQVSESSYLTE